VAGSYFKSDRGGLIMLLTLFLAIVFCAAITLMLVSAVVLVKDKKLFSSAPKEALELVIFSEMQKMV
jgi:hypothetical protein